MATAVSTYWAASGSPTLLCSLNAQGAFDHLPHSVMFKCAMNAIPDRALADCLLLVQKHDIFLKMEWK